MHRRSGWIAAAAWVLLWPGAGTGWTHEVRGWVLRHPAQAPTMRAYHAMAYDSVRQKTVLFGGSLNANVFGDTWEWDGTTWTQRSPLFSPPVRWGHCMAYDSARRRTVLFGGAPGSSGNYADTWEWDGANWTQSSPSTSPTARHQHTMTYDSARRRTVLFGGGNYLGVRFADTWEWDGTNWTQRFVAPFPSARYGAAMAYDSVRQKAVLFGGSTGSAELWELDGTGWTLRGYGAGPSGLYNHSMAFDAPRQLMVVYGGQIIGGPVSGQTWEWDGTSWRPRATTVCLSAGRIVTPMAYDSARERITLFSGFGNINDTWEYGSCSDPCCGIGPGHCTGGLPVACATQPRIGTMFQLTFNNPGPAAGLNLCVAGGQLSPPSGMGPPGVCASGFLHAFPTLVLAQLGNPATISIGIPNDPVLIGQSLALQCASFESSGCFRLTEALMVRIQS